MQITVKTGGLLYKHLPDSRTGNRASVDVPEDTTAASLLGELGMPSDQTYLVIVNGELVPEQQRAATSLADGDKVSINPPLKGG